MLFRSHVRLTTQPIEEAPNPEHVRQVMRMFPAERMAMFSTDFPHWDGDTPDFTAASFPPEIRARVMGLTACELYGLDPAGTGVTRATPHVGHAPSATVPGGALGGYE